CVCVCECVCALLLYLLLGVVGCCRGLLRAPPPPLPPPLQTLACRGGAFPCLNHQDHRGGLPCREKYVQGLCDSLGLPRDTHRHTHTLSTVNKDVSHEFLPMEKCGDMWMMLPLCRLSPVEQKPEGALTEALPKLVQSRSAEH